MSYRYKKIQVEDGTNNEHRVILGIPKGNFNICVHHKDGNGKNNSLENLEIMSRSEHAILHGLGITNRKFPVFQPDEEGKGTCRVCGEKKEWSEFRRDKYYKNGRQRTCKACVREYNKNKRMAQIEAI